jgi:hypothetical protein
MKAERSTRPRRLNISDTAGMALEVDDMEKTADYLRTKGVDIADAPSHPAERIGFAPDSPPEGAGFEPSIPAGVCQQAEAHR